MRRGAAPSVPLLLALWLALAAPGLGGTLAEDIPPGGPLQAPGAPWLPEGARPSSLPNLWAQAETALEVYSRPPGCSVWLDRRYLGVTPLRILLAPGTHLLRVSGGEAYKPYIEQVTLRSGETLRREVSLQAHTRTLLEQAWALLRQGQREQALPYLQQAADGRPRQPEAYWWMGLIQWQRGDLDRALQAFRDYADYRPDFARLYLYLGDIHERQGRPGQAVTAYKLALLKSPGLGEALADPPPVTWNSIRNLQGARSPRDLLRLAWLYEQKGQMYQALQPLHRALDQVFGDWASGDPLADIPSPQASPGPQEE